MSPERCGPAGHEPDRPRRRGLHLAGACGGAAGARWPCHRRDHRSRHGGGWAAGEGSGRGAGVRLGGGGAGGGGARPGACAGAAGPARGGGPAAAGGGLRGAAGEAAGGVAAECAELVAAAETSGAALGVNQNFVHHPAFARLRRAVEAGTLGRPVHCRAVYNVPLRQLAARQFGHWMFVAPGNILLEQAVHPLSQIVALAGESHRCPRAGGRPSVSWRRAVRSRGTLDVLLAGRAVARAAALRGRAVLSVLADHGDLRRRRGGRRHFWQTRSSLWRRTRWMPSRSTHALARPGYGGGDRRPAALRKPASLCRLHAAACKAHRRLLPGACGGSVAAFHAAVDAGARRGWMRAFGARLVALCEDDRRPRCPRHPRWPPPAPAILRRPSGRRGLGGTGFIGSHGGAALRRSGHRVAVMARGTQPAGDLFRCPRSGSCAATSAMPARSRGRWPAARVVINLAHGGGGGSGQRSAAAWSAGRRSSPAPALPPAVRG